MPPAVPPFSEVEFAYTPLMGASVILALVVILVIGGFAIRRQSPSVARRLWYFAAALPPLFAWYEGLVFLLGMDSVLAYLLLIAGAATLGWLSQRLALR